MKTLRFFFLLCSLLLTACSYNPFTGVNNATGSPLGAAIGAGVGAGTMALIGGSKPLIALGGLGGGAVGYYVTTLRYDAGGIIQEGGKVYQVGRLIGIYIPTDNLFEPNTAELLPQAHAVLDSAANVLARFPNNNILISGNTSGFYRGWWERRLSEKRAQVVSAYLWGAGINNFEGRSNDTRKLTYVGYGNFFPIANVYTNEGIRQSSRIQITSYPSDCDLLIDQRHATMNNMGRTDDDISTYPSDVKKCTASARGVTRGTC